MAFNFNLPKISMPQFYKWGTILFGIGVVGSFINVNLQWDFLNVGGKISMVSSFLFQILLFLLFYGFYRTTKNQPQVIEDPKLDEFLKELKNSDDELKNQKEVKGGTNKNGKKNLIKN